MDINIRGATSADYPVLLERLSRAFLPQPFTRWLCGDDSRSLERAALSIAVEIDRLHSSGLIFTTAGLHGGAIWAPPGYTQNFWQTIRSGWKMLNAVGLTSKTIAQFKAYQQLERAHPKPPHYYLSILGVAPEFQNMGIGSMLLKHGLAIADQHGMPAYLETDTENALRFYRRHGFGVVETLRFASGELTVYRLWREPSPRH